MRVGVAAAKAAVAGAVVRAVAGGWAAVRAAADLAVVGLVLVAGSRLVQQCFEFRKYQQTPRLLRLRLP